MDGTVGDGSDDRVERSMDGGAERLGGHLAYGLARTHSLTRLDERCVGYAGALLERKDHFLRAEGLRTKGSWDIVGLNGEPLDK